MAKADVRGEVEGLGLILKMRRTRSISLLASAADEGTERLELD